MMLTAIAFVMPQLAMPLLAATDEEVTEATMGTGFADSFWVVAALFVVVALLGLDMVRRLRRAKNREEILAELAPEVEAMRAEQSGGAAAPAQGDGRPGEADPRA